jgi:hypothetical protein
MDESEESSVQWLNALLVALAESQSALVERGLVLASAHVALAIKALEDHRC